MYEALLPEKIPGLADLGNVIPEGYNYSKKKFSAVKPFNLPGACLKWYNLYLPGKEITREEEAETKSFLKSETENGSLNLESELGFVILHRAGDYLLLLVSAWRNTNEIWETSYWKKSTEPDSYTPFKFKTDHKATYCVWELGAVGMSEMHGYDS